MGTEFIYVTPHAWNTPVETDSDRSNNIPDEYDNTQLALEWIVDKVAISASPGFTWGKSGNITNAWLVNDTVPSNLSGRNIFLHNAKIEMIYTKNEKISTYDLTIYEHDGTTYTPLRTISVVGARGVEVTVDPPVSATQGKDLAAKITSGSAKNPTAGLLMVGTKTP